MIKFGSLLLLLSFSAHAGDLSYPIEKEINLSLENSARLQLEKEQSEQKISDLQKKIRERKVMLLKRASALAYLKDYQFGALFSKSENPSQLDRHLKIFERLSKYDIGLFKDFLSSLKMLSVTRADLEKTIQNISVSVEQMNAQQADLVAKENARQAEVKQKNLASLIKLKGHLARPLDGSLIWSYGAKLDDAKQFVFVSKGLLIKSHPGADVKAVGPGVIIFSDVVRHWRETLIIQHDDNYYSVYSGLKSPSLRMNDTVETNQIIGNADSDEVYFELRHFDNPINPKNWFKESL